MTQATESRVVKTCKACETEKPVTDFALTGWKDTRRGTCKACRATQERDAWKGTHHRPSRAPEYKRRERLKRLFGITLEQYDAMLAEQHGVCAICGEARSWNRREGDILVVDHDHTTGVVRGLLCHACNQTLGLMRDDPERLLTAAAYLVQSSAPAVTP